jgi:putative endonuclease
MDDTWFVYLLECSDGTYYTGVTNDVERRVAQHNAGTGAKYTRGRRPVRLVCTVACEGLSAAQSLESRLHRAAKAVKLAYFSTHGTEW